MAKEKETTEFGKVEPPVAAPATVTADQMLTMMDRMTAAFEKLADVQQRNPENQQVNTLLDKLSDAMVRMSETQLQGSQLIADQTTALAVETKKAHRPSNEVPRNVSVFNRRGTLLGDHPDPDKRYAKPLLKCQMFIPWLVEWESCNREEVELLNLLEPGEYILKRIDNTRVRVTIRITYGVDEKTPSRLDMGHDTAFGNDQFKLMPALSNMLRQILKQHDMGVRAKLAKVLSDEDEEALIEAGELSVSA
jgi:hypothetical protein